MPQTFCTTCGSRRHGDHRFCTSCGQPFDPAPSYADRPISTVTLAKPGPRLPDPAQPAPPPPPGHGVAMPTSARTARRAPLVAAAFGALTLVVAASVAGVVVLREDGTGGGYSGDRLPLAAPVADGATEVDMLAEPTSEWTFDPAVYSPGAELGPMQQFEGDPGYAEQIVIGDLSVLSVVDDGASGGGWLVGVDTGTGEVRWDLRTSGYVPGCQAVEDSTRLICALPDGDSPGSAVLTLLDAADGQAVATGEETYAYPYVTAGDGVFFVQQGGTASEPRLDALDAETLEVLWSRPAEPGSVDQVGVPGLLTVADGVAVVESGSTQWVHDAATGELSEVLVDEPGFDGDYRIEHDDPWTSSARTTISDQGGFTMLASEGDPWHLDGGWNAILQGRVGIGETYYDLTTGEPLWTDAGGRPGDGHLVDADADLVVVTADDGSTRLLDLADGHEMWSRTSPSWNASYSPEAAVVLADGVVEVSGVDGRDGGWSRDLNDLLADESSIEAIGAVEQSTDAVVAVGFNGARGFSGFPAAGGTDSGTDAVAEGDGGTEYVTDCGTEPELTPVEAVAADGGVSVTFTMTATCPEGQWLAHDAVGVTMDVDGVRYLSGSFDFSSDPRWVPAEGTEQQLVFPPGSAFGSPEEINDAIERDGGSGDVISVDCEREAGSEPGPVPTDPADGAPGTDPVSSEDTARTDDEDPEETALETLQRMAAKDAPYLDAEATSGWIAQLSSKDLGLVADGLTWTYEDILAEHLRLRLRYPDVRLAWSTDWGSFQEDGYWVTVVATDPTPTPRPVLDFCVDESFDRDHCFAKRLTREGPSDGKIMLLPE